MGELTLDFAEERFDYRPSIIHAIQLKNIVQEYYDDGIVGDKTLDWIKAKSDKYINTILIGVSYND